MQTEKQHVPALILDGREKLAEMMSSGEINKYLYSFKQGKKEVTDLNVDGINQLAISLGVSIEDVTIIGEDETQFTVKAIAVNADGVRHHGIARESKFNSNGYPNPHALANATSKAQRNAKKGLLPMAEVRAVIKGTGRLPVENDNPLLDEGKRKRTTPADLV